MEIWLASKKNPSVVTGVDDFRPVIRMDVIQGVFNDVPCRMRTGLKTSLFLCFSSISNRSKTQLKLLFPSLLLSYIGWMFPGAARWSGKQKLSLIGCSNKKRIKRNFCLSLSLAKNKLGWVLFFLLLLFLFKNIEEKGTNALSITNLASERDTDIFVPIVLF